MGNSLSCECLTEAFTSVSGGLTSQMQSLQILQSKTDQLKKDTKFQKKVLLGMSSQEIILRLSDDSSTIIWRCPATTASSTWAAVSGASAEEFGEVNLVDNVATVRRVAPAGFAIVDFSNKVLLEVAAAPVAANRTDGSSTNSNMGAAAVNSSDNSGVQLRDAWVDALNELLAEWISHPGSKPRARISAAGTSNKTAYFAQREKEIQERKAVADERKKKYTAGGMKYTAIAMMNRADSVPPK